MDDNLGPKVRERVWIEKFSHEGDEPVKTETVLVEDNVIKEVTKHGQEKAVVEEGSVNASIFSGEGSKKVTPSPWQTMRLVIRAADEAGIEIEAAMKFLSALHIEVASKGITVTRQ